MTKKDLIDAIGIVTGVPSGESSQYHSMTNTGGRRLLGTDTEILCALVMAGSISADMSDTYTE